MVNGLVAESKTVLRETACNTGRNIFDYLGDSEKSIKTKRHAAALGELIVLLSVSNSVVNLFPS